MHITPDLHACGHTRHPHNFMSGIGIYLFVVFGGQLLGNFLFSASLSFSDQHPFILKSIHAGL